MSDWSRRDVLKAGVSGPLLTAIAAQAGAEETDPATIAAVSARRTFPARATVSAPSTSESSVRSTQPGSSRSIQPSRSSSAPLSQWLRTFALSSSGAREWMEDWRLQSSLSIRMSEKRSGTFDPAC